MDNQFRMCRVCTDSEKGVELVPIFEKNNQIALGIFVISGIKVLEFNNYKIPALICLNCVNELAKAMTFRRKCRETDAFIRKSAFEADSLIWTESQDDASGSCTMDMLKVKQEIALDGQKIIKDEPFDDFNIDLFENIDTILEENHGESDESNSSASILKKNRRGECFSKSSYSEIRKKRRSRSSTNKSVELREFELW